ncbi:MAG: phage protease [Verrucomicrobiota bacterium]
MNRAIELESQPVEHPIAKNVLGAAFANSGETPERGNVPSADLHALDASQANACLGFANQLALQHDGWAMISPYGDFPGPALTRLADGRIEKRPAIQRVTREVAEALVRRFKSPWGRLKRFFTGCPIFIGHPDVPGLANEYPDKTPQGVFVDLEARADGLYGLPVFTNGGSDLVERKRLVALSPYWTARQTGEVNGIPIFTPDELKSAGLTNRPNLPVRHLLNERPAASTPNPTQKPIMDKALLLAWLKEQGIELPADAGDEQLQAALAQIAQRLAQTAPPPAHGSAANEQFRADLERLAAERDTLSASYANERAERIGLVLDLAVADGRITIAQRPQWAARLQGDFANSHGALQSLAPVCKTRAVTASLGERRVELANIQERTERVQSLVAQRMKQHGETYDAAFANARREHPALFAQMQQPGK